MSRAHRPMGEAEVALRGWLARRLRQHRAALRAPPADRPGWMRWQWLNKARARRIEQGYALLRELERQRGA